MLKTLERLIDRFLRDGILSTFKIHPNQHAYQSRTAESALRHLEAKKTLDIHQQALGGFIDLVAAFSHSLQLLNPAGTIAYHSLSI